MIDFARITVIAGNGGNGAGSFTHIKGKRRGKADGGDGGRGGDVHLLATENLNTLEPFRFIKEYKAQNGANGASRRRKGADGEDLVIKVPVGTVVKVESQSDKSKSKVNKLYISHSDFDLVDDFQQALVARGGDGGRGNSHLRDDFGRRPLIGEKGEMGEKVELVLELKLIADVGLIGLPNAGKSALISAITSSKPKIADYPFTTLEPNLGVMKVESQSDKSKSKVNKLYTSHSDFDSIVLADIPGLIEGASRGKGLGDLFLRHIERTKVLVHLIDISSANISLVKSAGALVKHPGGVSSLWENYQTVRNELRSYSKELVKKKEIIVLNKIDLFRDEELQDAINQFKLHRKKVIPISSKNGENLKALIVEILRKLKWFYS